MQFQSVPPTFVMAVSRRATAGTRAVDENRLVETGTLDRIVTVDEVARIVEVFAVRGERSSQAQCCASTAANNASPASFARKLDRLNERPLCAPPKAGVP